MFLGEFLNRSFESMKKKTKTPTLHDLAVRLCEGGQIEFGGLTIKAKDYVGAHVSCVDCQMDSLCDIMMSDLCLECDFYHNHAHLLELVSNK